MCRPIQTLILSLAAAASSAACSGTGQYRVEASFPTPDMIYVAPGVYAVANADAPVFYANNDYWLYDGGLWYRSNYLNGGWYYSTPPYALRQLRSPFTYHRYYRYPIGRRVHVEFRDRRYPRDRDQPARRVEVERRDRPTRVERRDRPTRVERRDRPTQIEVERRDRDRTHRTTPVEHRDRRPT